MFQVLQQQLIKAERERILQQIQSGALPADTNVAQLLGVDSEDLDDDDLAEPLRKKLKAAQQKQQVKTKTANQGGRR